MGWPSPGRTRHGKEEGAGPGTNYRPGRQIYRRHGHLQLSPWERNPLIESSGQEFPHPGQRAGVTSARTWPWSLRRWRARGGPDGASAGGSQLTHTSVSCSCPPQRAFHALCHSTHLYGRRLVLEWADSEVSLPALRRKTAERFHGKRAGAPEGTALALAGTGRAGPRAAGHPVSLPVRAGRPPGCPLSCCPASCPRSAPGGRPVWTAWLVSVPFGFRLSWVVERPGRKLGRGRDWGQGVYHLPVPSSSSAFPPAGFLRAERLALPPIYSPLCLALSVRVPAASLGEGVPPLKPLPPAAF